MPAPLSVLIGAKTKKAAKAVPLLIVNGKTWDHDLTRRAKSWGAVQGFTGKSGQVLAVPDGDGGLKKVLAALDDPNDPWAWAGVAGKVPAGIYRLEVGEEATASAAALGWALNAYRFERYRTTEPAEPPALVWPEAADKVAVSATVEAMTLVRDLINTPAADMGPHDIAEAATALAEANGASVSITMGDDLVTNFPAVYAVGKGASPERAPRLIDLTWTGPKGKTGPKITLVGKGVCFDTGGLDIKPASAMKLMKKDMGGAANVLGLASMLMAAKLPIRLRVIIPAVENAVSDRAFRPFDIVRTRSGKTIEIGHTDAEGRVILADALTLACEDTPDLLIDLATLTGAARSALGPDLPALFTDDETLASDLMATSPAVYDPVWRLPLHKPYRRYNDSKNADISNSGDSPFAGAITAALFLQTFVSDSVPWAHVDLYGWNAGDRPGRPQGGEAQGIRGIAAVLKNRYGKNPSR